MRLRTYLSNKSIKEMESSSGFNFLEHINSLEIWRNDNKIILGNEIIFKQEDKVCA